MCMYECTYLSIGANIHLPRLVISPGNRPSEYPCGFYTYCVIEAPATLEAGCIVTTLQMRTPIPESLSSWCVTAQGGLRHLPSGWTVAGSVTAPQLFWGC